MFVSTLPIFGRNANKKLVPQQAGEPSCKTEQPLLPWKSVDLESALCKLNHYGLQNDTYCTVCWHRAETWRTGDEFSLAQQSCRRKWLGKRNLCGALRRRCAHCGYIELKSQINKMSIYRRTLIHKFVYGTHSWSGWKLSWKQRRWRPECLALYPSLLKSFQVAQHQGTVFLARLELQKINNLKFTREQFIWIFFITFSSPKTRTNVTANWKNACPKILRNMIRLNRLAFLPYGFRSSNCSVGISVDSANDASESWIKLINNIGTGFSGDSCKSSIRLPMKVTMTVYSTPVAQAATKAKIKAATLTVNWNCRNLQMLS